MTQIQTAMAWSLAVLPYLMAASLGLGLSALGVLCYSRFTAGMLVIGLTFVLVTHNLAVVAHMCDRLAVMNQGRIVEELSVEQLRANEPSEAYTRQLLKASLGYDREAARSLATFD